MNTKKFYSGNVAYTTPSGRMHIGHGLGQITADVAIRFSALQTGQNPFFPFAIHSTGKDLVKIIRQLEKTESLAPILSRYNLSEEERERIISQPDTASQVNQLVGIYKNQYQEVLTKLGTCVDFSTFFSSHQTENQRFTQWTLRKLDERGLIVKTSSQRPYCVECKDIKAIEKDLSEVTTDGKIDWENLRVQDGQITGGNFYCRLHSSTPITVETTEERAINYGDKQIQEETIALAQRMRIFPPKHKADIPEIIKTRKAKPFERKPLEMVGAQSPFDENKKVEALADSNIYMEFYPFAQLVNSGQIRDFQLTDQLFDYVILGKGNREEVLRSSKLESAVLDELTKRFSERYPIDLSLIGFEHKEVHLPFSLFTHAAILPENYFFREYLITGHITNKGEKMSKSKGNVVYLNEIVRSIEEQHQIPGISKDSSGDILRFFLSYYQYLDKDFDWDNKTFVSVGVGGVKRFVKGIKDLSNLASFGEAIPTSKRDKWISTYCERTIEEITANMLVRNHRDALISIVDLLGSRSRDYLSGNSDINPHLVGRLLSSQIDMVYPVMPRIANELSSTIRGQKVSSWPTQNPRLIFPEEYEEEEHMRLGKDYIQSYVKQIRTSAGRLIGRGEVKEGDSIQITLPSDYTRTIIEKEKISLPNNLRPTYSVDSNTNQIRVKKI